VSRSLLATAATAATLLAAASPVAADEFTDVVESALEAYAEGDITVAREELDYAMQLLTAMKADSLSTFLPEPLDGWTREQADVEGAAPAMAMFGGGTAAAATYRRGAEEMTITLLANSPMVSGIGAMVSGMASLGGSQTVRIQRTQFSVDGEEMQGVAGGKVLVSVAGNASVEDKTAHLETMDFRALSDF
jgi:hypothetical protein